MTTITDTITCPGGVPWCTEHDGHTEPDGSRWDCHNSVDTSVSLVEGLDTLAVYLDQFISQGHPDPADDWHEQPKVNLVADGIRTSLSPAQAREVAAMLLELADLAEARA